MSWRFDSRAFRAALQGAERDLSRVLLSAFDRTSDIIVNDMKVRTNTAIRGPHTGRLVQSLRHQPASGDLRSGYVVDFMAGGTGGVDYAAPFYLGARPHVIEARPRPGGKPGALRFVANGAFVFARRVRHPGNAPRRIMREAIVAGLDGLERRVHDGIRLVLSRHGVEVP